MPSGAQQGYRCARPSKDIGSRGYRRTRRYLLGPGIKDIGARGCCRAHYRGPARISARADIGVRTDFYWSAARISRADIGARTDIYSGPARISARADIGAARV